MQPIVSDTLFTASPHWDWLIVLYFFFGGIAGGAFVFSAILDLFGAPTDRPLARLGYLVALPALALCPPLLILDLNRPERFWHMLIQNNTMAPMLKTYSPMSVGSWALFLFGIFVTIGFVGALAEGGPSTSGFSKLSFLGRGMIAKVNALLGGFFGFFVAGYTGVLLSVSNRPIWADTPMMGALFLLSGAATAAALLLWLGRDRVAASSLAWLARVESWISIAEIVALIALLVTLGPVARLFLSGWGVLLAIVVVVGMLVPLAMHYRQPFRPASLGAAAALALVGGLGLRAVMILSSGAV